MLTLARWPNVLLSAAGVVVGAWWARGDAAWHQPRVAWAAAAAMFIAAFVNMVNDLDDVAIDCVAHPERPLASGALSPRAATLAMRACCVLALGASAVAGGEALFAVTAGVVVAASAYSPGLKRHGVAGNVAVAVVASLPFVYGAYAAGSWRAGLALVLVAVPLHFARELAKDIDDAEADAAGGRVTLPHRVGPRRTRATIAAAVAVHAACVMFLLAPLAWRALALVPALAVAALAAARAGGGTAPGAPALFKLSMLLAMGALFVLR